MAKISKSADAPNDIQRALFGGVEVDFSGSDSYETDDAAVLSNARAHPWFEVEEDVVDVEAVNEDYDPNDPHDNPSSDHLSSHASDEARAAAEANEAALREQVQGQQNISSGDNPTVADSLEQTFDIVGTDAEPVLPEGEVAEPEQREVVPAQREVPSRLTHPDNSEDVI